jgi:hypothetical protein
MSELNPTFRELLNEKGALPADMAMLRQIAAFDPLLLDNLDSRYVVAWRMGQELSEGRAVLQSLSAYVVLNKQRNAMLLLPVTYDELRQAIMIAHGKNLAVELLNERSLAALIELGILVRIGGGLMEVTSHGERLYVRLQRGEHLRELEPPPHLPVYAPL